MTTAAARVEPTPANPNPAPASAGEAKPAPATSLDALLAEYETAKPAAPAEPKPAAPAATPTPKPTPAEPQITFKPEEVAGLRAMMQDASKRQAEEGVSGAVKTLKDASEALAGVPDQFIRGILYERAANDPRFLSAFGLREQQPDKWKAVLKALGSEIEGIATVNAGTKLAQDQARVRASVRGLATAPVSTNPVSNEEWGQLSPGRFQKAKRLMAAGRSDREAFNAVTSAPQR